MKLSDKERLYGYLVDRNGTEMHYFGGGPKDGEGENFLRTLLQHCLSPPPTCLLILLNVFENCCASLTHGATIQFQDFEPCWENFTRGHAVDV